MKKLEKIKNELIKNKDNIVKKYHVKEIGLFGSYVRNEQKDGSDLDVLIEFSITPGFFKFIELEEYLKTILDVDVDLVMKSSLKPNIGKNILNEVIYI